MIHLLEAEEVQSANQILSCSREDVDNVSKDVHKVKPEKVRVPDAVISKEQSIVFIEKIVLNRLLDNRRDALEEVVRLLDKGLREAAGCCCRPACEGNLGCCGLAILIHGTNPIAQRPLATHRKNQGGADEHQPHHKNLIV